MLAIGTHALAQGIAELLQAVVADTGGFRRGDVGGDDVADRRRQRQAPGKRFATGHAVAGNAVTGSGQVLATLDLCVIGCIDVECQQHQCGKGSKTPVHGLAPSLFSGNNPVWQDVLRGAQSQCRSGQG